MGARDHFEGQPVHKVATSILLKNRALAVLYLFASSLESVAFALTEVEGATAASDLASFAVLAADTLFFSLFGLAAYTTVLLGRSGFSALSVRKVVRYFWRDVLLMLATVFITLLLTILGAFWYHADWDTVVSGYPIFLVLLPIIFVVYSFYGSWLPAVAADGDIALKSAYWRGRSTFEKTFVQLMLWGGPPGIAMVLCYGLSSDTVLSVDGIVSWPTLAMEFLGALAELVLLSCIVVVLSRAYLRTR